MEGAFARKAPWLTDIPKFCDSYVVPLKDANLKFAENIVIIVTVVKSFMQGLRMIIHEFAVLDDDSDDSDNEGKD